MQLVWILWINKCGFFFFVIVMFLPSYHRVGQEKHLWLRGVKCTKILIGNGYFSQNRKKLNTEVQDKGEWDSSQILATFRWKSNLNVVHSAFEEALVQLPNLDCLTQSPMKEYSEGVFLNNKPIFSGGAALSSCVCMGLVTNHYLWRKS